MEARSKDSFPKKKKSNKLVALVEHISYQIALEEPNIIQGLKAM